jgi:hypothetical protein
MEIKFTDSAGLIVLGAVLLGLVLFPEFVQVIGNFLGRKIETQWKTRTRIGVGIFGVALMLIGILLPFCYSLTPPRGGLAPTHTPTMTPPSTSTPTMTPVLTDTPPPTSTPGVVATKVVALKTYHNRYVTATDEIDEATGEVTDWKLEAETTEIEAWEIFTLLCLDDGKIAFRTFHDRYVTAMGGDWDWILRAETRDRLAYEEFIVVQPDTWERLPCHEVEQLPCLEMFKRLEAGEVKIALKTYHNRYVTAMGEDRDWIIVAEREESKGLDLFEGFTVIPQ